MKAFVITLKNNLYSNKVADRCIQTAKAFGIDVEKFWGVSKENAQVCMESHGLTWTWANNNTSNYQCPETGLLQFPYKTSDLRAKIGCSMSHYLLWKLCVSANEPFLILEHDAVFVREFPSDFNFGGICQINDPAGCTRKGNWWSKQMIERGGSGTFPKTRVTKDEDFIPDGLAGNSAYVIRSYAAQHLVDLFHWLGVWPNDAIMCIQLVPYLQEHYPFITKVKQEQSTTIL